MKMPLVASPSTTHLAIDDPTLDIGEAQHLMQRLLADKIDSYAAIDELRLLLVSGAQADGVVIDGLTPLHYACHRGYFAAAKLLLVRGAKVNAVDSIGYSALHLCAEKGYFRLLKLLLEYMARVCYVPQSEKDEFPSRDLADEPLRLAIERGHYECARLLLENGADPNTKYFMGPEITLVSPLETNLMRLLLQYGADPNLYSRDGLTPLMKACRHKEKGIKAIQILLDFGADINAMARVRQEYRTPLHYAVMSGSMPLIQFLIENNANVNMPKTYEKPTPLQIAVMKDNIEMVKFLLDNGADPNAMHGCFGSALHISLCTDNEYQHDIVSLLLKYGANPNIYGPDADGRMMKSPFVEFLRIKDNQILPKPRIMTLLLSHGAKVIGKQSSQDPCGQLRNIINIVKLSELHAEHLLSLMEDVDATTLERLCHSESIPVETRQFLVEITSRPKTLQQLCRLRIRSMFQPLSPEAIKNLPLPVMTKKYILGMN